MEIRSFRVRLLGVSIVLEYSVVLRAWVLGALSFQASEMRTPANAKHSS